MVHLREGLLTHKRYKIKFESFTILNKLTASGICVRMREFPQFARAAAYVLYTRRTAAGMSQEELAEKSGMERTYISRMERGIHLPSVRALLVLSEQFHLTASDLLREMEDACARGLSPPPSKPRGRRVF